VELPAEMLGQLSGEAEKEGMIAARRAGSGDEQGGTKKRKL